VRRLGSGGNSNHCGIQDVYHGRDDVECPHDATVAVGFHGGYIEVVRKHVVACSSVSATENVKAFGVDTDKYFFRFWDWVGGRYSVCGAAGAVPISLMYGFDLFEKFLEGARSMDQHFLNAPMKDNIPIIMGLLGVWNSSFMDYNSRALIPYAQALLRLPAHIQQLDMEVRVVSVEAHYFVCYELM